MSELEHLPAQPSSTVEQAEAVAAAGPVLSQQAQADHIMAAFAQLRKQLANLELERLMNTLKECGGNQSRAAERLGMSRRSLVYRLTALGLTRRRKRT